YMKGRVSYEQLNAVVEGINTAVKAKYRILTQPVKALNNHARKLQQRFKDQETKDTKGNSPNKAPYYSDWVKILFYETFL
ncbi:Spindle and kinetochore-associated protein 1, partial [Xenotaenia resolanae]